MQQGGFSPGIRLLVESKPIWLILLSKPKMVDTPLPDIPNQKEQEDMMPG